MFAQEANFDRLCEISQDSQARVIEIIARFFDGLVPLLCGVFLLRRYARMAAENRPSSWRVIGAWVLILVGVFNLARTIFEARPALDRQQEMVEMRRADRALTKNEMEDLLRKSGQRVIFDQVFRDQVGFSLTVPEGYVYASDSTSGTRLVGIGPNAQFVLVSRRHSQASMAELKVTLRNEIARDCTHIAVSQEQAGQGIYGDSLRYVIDARKDGAPVRIWVGMFKRIDQLFVVTIIPGAASDASILRILDSFRVE